MKKWEYTIITPSPVDDVLEKINDLGKDGWRIISPRFGGTFPGVLMEREIPELKLDEQSPGREKEEDMVFPVG